ncbi:helix-turn-helix domain-containing protein [uncultured Bacteroides sp.]|jgi:AraC-type DNA-binding domain-containing proteins|uniref:AraC family transcriptional regulator n=1 Tax=uncultured Bacteroides sp. TaxID=162156 RepID=UPI0026772677|nr:helix-turn-helix domain-containing protein [uncultured Bacteroides sp.]
MQDNENKETLEIHVLGDDFKFYQNLKYLPLDSYPSNIQSALIVYSLRGTAKISVYDDVHWVQPKELIILLPGQFVSFSDPSEDFLTVTMVLSSSMFSDALSGAPRFTPHFFFYMRSHYYYPQNERDVMRLSSYLGMIKDKVLSRDAYRRELIIHLLRYLYLELFNAYEKESALTSTRKDTRKEELANRFFNLIMKHFRENKEVAFYADKLCITSKYLTMVIKETSGRSAKDWIVEYMILEIKALLKNTSLNIQEIAIKTNFANQSSLGRFFRKHTGMSLSQYRIRHPD